MLTSPALGWDNEIIYVDEKNYAAKKSKLSVKIFMAVGDLEDVSGFQIKKADAGRIAGFQVEQFSGEVFVRKISASK